MARSKLKKKKKSPQKYIDEIPAEEAKVPIPDLPDTFLWMKVKSGTKIRNVLEYSLKEFGDKDASIVWSGTGQGIAKTITCAEIFKRKISGLHQITKLRFVQSKETDDGLTNENSRTCRTVPEIHILLSRRVLDTKVPGYQAPGVCSMFQESKDTKKIATDQDDKGPTKVRMLDATGQQFASMGLRTGQKRSRGQSQASSASTKKSKKKCSDKSQ